ECATPLAAATDLRVTYDEFTGALTATWTDNSSHEEGYLISVWVCWYYGEECEWSYLYSVGPDETSFTVAGYSAIGDVLAYGDGDYSDPAVWASDASTTSATTASMRQSSVSSRATRPRLAPPTRRSP